MPLFFVEKWEKLLPCKSFSHFSTKNVSVFGYKVIKHWMSWPLNELVKLTMLWTTGPRAIKILQFNENDIGADQFWHSRSWYPMLQLLKTVWCKFITIFLTFPLNNTLWNPIRIMKWYRKYIKYSSNTSFYLNFCYDVQKCTEIQIPVHVLADF